jgi:hypothetical protein
MTPKSLSQFARQRLRDAHATLIAFIFNPGLQVRLQRGTVREPATYSSPFVYSYIFCTVIADDGAKMPSRNHDDVESSPDDDLGSESDSEMINNNINTWIKHGNIHDFRARFNKLKDVDPDMVSGFALKIIKKFQSRAAAQRAVLNKAEGARRHGWQFDGPSQTYENGMPSTEEKEETAERGPGKEEDKEKLELKEWLLVLFPRMKKEWGRQILSTEIVNLGRYRTSNKKDKKEYEPTFRLIREILESSTHLLHTTSHDKSQSLFHEAAKNGLCDVIDLCNELILKEAGDDKLGRATVSMLIAKEDSENHSALYLAVQEDVEHFGYTTIIRLMKLLELGTIAIQGEDLRATLKKTVQFNSLGLLRALLGLADGEDKTGAASGAPTENGNLPVQKGKFDWILSEILEFAIEKNKIDIAKFLVSIRPSILEDKEFDFLGCAVKQNLEAMVKFLLLERPKLALDRSTPILTSLVRTTINSTKIESHVLPILMRGTRTISHLRKHLEGGSCM